MEINRRFSLSPIYNSDLNTLAEDLGMRNANFNILCLDDDNGPYYEFSSNLFNELIEPDEVYQSAIQLIQLMDGVLFLIFEEQTHLPKLSDLYKEKSRVIYKKTPPEFNFHFEKFLNADSVETTKPVALLLELAKKEKHLRELLYILGEPICYRQLYVAFETTQSLLDGEVKFKQLMGTELDARIQIFTNVANNFHAIGAQARHRDLARPMPKKTMTLEEAKDVIAAMVSTVVKQRYGIELPFYKKINITADDLF
jgi:hypothetical protein